MTGLSAPLSLVAQSAVTEEASLLDAVTVLSPRVANQEPVATVAMPVSTLRYEPGVDLQARNFAEGQADIAIRGGTFANSGWVLAGVPLYDPQTGHYYAEIPLAPAMLGAQQLATGPDLAAGGAWNATAGGVVQGWRPVRVGGELAVSAGDWSSYRADFITGVDLGGGWAADVAAAYSESDGPFANADHQLARYSGRLQHRGERSASDLAVGYQDKFFGWPNLYTPFNSPETEDIQTLLVIGTHQQQIGELGSFVEVGGAYRRNDDNYAYNRYAPVGPVPPYKHTTRVTTAGGRAHLVLSDRSAIDARLWVLADELESTSLLYGRFYSRTHFTTGATYSHTAPLADGRELELRAGLGYDTSNRGADAVTPVLEVALAQPDAVWQRWVLGYSTASQAPSYTAVAGNPNGGLFRGNRSLDRAESRTLEARGEFAVGEWTGSVGAFYRWDEDLIDWTFRNGVFGRNAAAVDLEVAGVEAYAMRSGERLDLVLGYAWLHKDADYGSATIDGSFYALNFPNHRVTAALIWRATDDLTLRLDNELRWQEPNPLRLNGKDEALLSSVGLYWRTPWDRRLQLSVQVDNLWDSTFEEIPAVPAAPRLWAVGARWRW
ncbi:TonB-dependent receptor [Actomonas aquatica]|uniref:TonB-dependent receptor n=1 Tax=Actomonas aquatica TaxID=2866162 RepID=A0ABZ1C8V8_9BACT|nr:TonB-dependent receptor [Opitutus sp. WL0086]WRQ87698.1 TonB-dependent receptor [Opitutus sp. WL0086]